MGNQSKFLLFLLQSSLDLSEFAKAAKKKLQSVRQVLLLWDPEGRFVFSVVEIGYRNFH